MSSPIYKGNTHKLDRNICRTLRHFISHSLLQQSASFSTGGLRRWQKLVEVSSSREPTRGSGRVDVGDSLDETRGNVIGEGGASEECWFVVVACMATMA